MRGVRDRANGTAPTVPSSGRIRSRSTSPRSLRGRADRVNVHIDQTGFLFEGANGDLMVGPNFLDHIVNELVWKTILPLPSWLAERMDLIAPNSTNDFPASACHST